MRLPAASPISGPAHARCSTTIQSALIAGSYNIWMPGLRLEPMSDGGRGRSAGPLPRRGRLTGAESCFCLAQPAVDDAQVEGGAGFRTDE